MLQPQTPHATDFSLLLAGVRACRPLCVNCNVPLDPETTGIRLHETEAGGHEKLCRGCYLGEIAEALTGNAPA